MTVNLSVRKRSEDSVINAKFCKNRSGDDHRRRRLVVVIIIIIIIIIKLIPTTNQNSTTNTGRQRFSRNFMSLRDS